MRVIAAASSSTLIVEIHEDEIGKIVGEQGFWGAKDKLKVRESRDLIGKEIKISEAWELMKLIKQIRSARKDWLFKLKQMTEITESVANPVLIEEAKEEK